MSDMAIISIISLVGWLIIAGGALASYQLGWSKLVQLALVWVAIFAGGYLLVTLIGSF